MTTQQDWLFRAEYLRMQATAKRRQAEDLQREATSYDHLANSAQHIAEQPIRDAIDELEASVNAAQQQPAN